MSEQDPIWNFDQDKNVSAFTTKQVLDDGLPILLVMHNEDDCSWTFLCDSTDNEEDSRLVTMEDIVAMDPSLNEIAEIPPGWVAFRDFVGDEWDKFEEGGEEEY